MNAFSSLILLIVIATLSMSIVAYSNYLVDKRRRTTFKLEKMKIRVEELEDVVLVLDSVCEKRIIPKLINDEIIEYYEIMRQINPSAGYLKAGLSNAQIRANKLNDESIQRTLNRACKSDAQIARYTAYLNEALQILRKQHTEGKLSSDEIQTFALDIEWLQLLVKVISNIYQGHKSYDKQDILGANAFYKKAQNDLLKSPHPDERRRRMISQLADILHGNRKFLDADLMPESADNPSSTSNTAQNKESDMATEEDMTDEITSEEAVRANAANNEHMESRTHL